MHILLLQVRKYQHVNLASSCVLRNYTGIGNDREKNILKLAFDKVNERIIMSGITVHDGGASHCEYMV